MRQAIVTGFGPFGPYAFNPTEDLARELDGKYIDGIQITGLVLPSTYYGAHKALASKIDELSPEIVVSLGLASEVRSLRLEMIGRNVMNGKYADADGLQPAGDQIINGAPTYYAVRSDSPRLHELLLAERIDSELSIDANGFICNSLVYLTSRKLHDENLSTRFAFMHAPWTSDYVDKINIEKWKRTIDKTQLRKAVEIVIKNI